MTRVHDMGGRFGDGAVVPEPQGIAEFKQEWHKTALALTVAAGGLGKWNIDIGRHARESLSPLDYTRFSYYEKWIGGLADLLVETGILSREELISGRAAGTVDGAPVTGEMISALIAQGGPSTRESDVAQRFRIGQNVRAIRPAGNRLVTGGHTRLPQYAAGARGQILLTHGAHVLPDSSAHRLGDAPEPLYTVVFSASELWTAPEHPKDEVTLDLWQSYLEPDA